MPFTQPTTPAQITMNVAGLPAWLNTVNNAIVAVLQPGSGGFAPGTLSIPVTLTAAQFAVSSFAPDLVLMLDSVLLNEYRCRGWNVSLTGSVSNPAPPNGDGQATSLTYTFTRFQT